MKDFTKLYVDLADFFDLGWDPGIDLNSETFSLKHLRLTEKLGHHGVSLKLWINPKANPNRLDFEIVGKFEGRGDFAAALRKFLLDGNQAAEVRPSRLTATSKIIYRELHGTHQEQTQQIRAFIQYLDSKLNDYSLKASTATSTSSNSRSSAVDRMIANANNAANQSGSESVTIKKHKEVRFESDEAFKAYVQELLAQQQGHCKLSGLPFADDSDEAKQDYHMSLDRIDSDGHYEAGNLQIVCRFINRWKSDSDNEDFKKLLEAVRSVPSSIQTTTKCAQTDK